MADRNPQIPDLGEMLGLPSEELQRPVQRGDLLDYYLGPTGIPDRLRAANEVLNPIRGISDAMYYSGQAFNPDLPAAERRRMAGQAAMETGIAALPVGLAKVAGRYMRAVPGGQADDAQAVVETMTGATPDLQDPSRRRFMAGMGAAAVAPMLPAEELLSTGTKVAARNVTPTTQVLEMVRERSGLRGEIAEAYRRMNELRGSEASMPELEASYDTAREQAASLEGGDMQLGEMILDTATDPDFSLTELRKALTDEENLPDTLFTTAIEKALGQRAQDRVLAANDPRFVENGRLTNDFHNLKGDINLAISGTKKTRAEALENLRKSKLVTKDEIRLLSEVGRAGMILTAF
jgi:uncharacterized protein YdcH (DUF465 family)